MKRITRLAALAVGALALVGGMTPPAHATTTASVTFVGSATVAGGIGYPVLTLGATVPTLNCLPLPTDTTTNCHPVYDHLRSVTFASTTLCTDEVVNVAKPGKDPAHAGPCTITAGGTVTGHCGLSGGQVSGTYTDSADQTATFDVHFTGVGGELVVTGHITKNGRTGKIVGVVTAVPVTTTPVLTPGGQSCTNKTQQDFIIVGEATGAIPTV